MEFLVRSASTWSVCQLLSFPVLTLGFTEVIGLTVMRFWGGYAGVEAAKLRPSYRQYDALDCGYIGFNKLFTVPFNHALILFCWSSNSVSWVAEGALLKISGDICVVPLLILADDFMYYCWHRALHWPMLYRHIHKHHHREHAPFRGADDAVNSHPVEYVVTACFIPASIVATSSLLSTDIHVAAVVLFLTVKVVLSYANHAMIDIRLKLGGVEVYASQCHQTHHQ